MPNNPLHQDARELIDTARELISSSRRLIQKSVRIRRASRRRRYANAFWQSRLAMCHYRRRKRRPSK
jgi:hypothetical protein